MVITPFLCNVAALRRTPGTRRRETLSGPIPDLRVLGTTVPGDAEVALDLFLDSASDGIVASGTVSAPWVGECRRCLQPLSGTAVAQVRELFEPQPDPEETYPLQGDQIDLEPLACEAVLLELPQAPLCREDCKGLCPTCGADLNAVEMGKETCSCDPAPRRRALGRTRRPPYRTSDRSTNDRLAAPEPQERLDGRPQEEDVEGQEPQPARIELEARGTLASVCPQCRQAKQPHIVCANCGWYGGRQAIEVD